MTWNRFDICEAWFVHAYQDDNGKGRKLCGGKEKKQMDRQWIVGHIMRSDKWKTAEPSKIPNWSKVCHSEEEAQAVLASILEDINEDQRAADAEEYSSALEYNESDSWGFLILALSQGESE